jgi:predicted kinase
MSPEISPDPGGKLLRLLRPSIVVLCGPSGCGKSTFAKRHFRPTQIISSDWARALVCDDERDQRFNQQAFDLVHFLLVQRLTLNRLCVVDSTALTPQARKDLLSQAKKCQVPATLVLFDVPLETCVERDEKRERPVGRTIVERQYQTFELSKDGIRQEGFDQIVEFQGGDSDKLQIEILFRPVLRPQRTDAGPSGRPERPRPPFGDRTGGNGVHTSSHVRPSVPSPLHPVVNSRPVAPAAASTPPNVVAPAEPIETSQPATGAPPVHAGQTAVPPSNVGKKAL